MAKRLRRHHSTKLKTHGQEHRAGQKCLCASFQYCRQAIWEHFNQRAGNAFKTDLGLRLSMDFSMDLPTTVVLFVSPRFAHNLGCLADISLAWILKRARGPKQTDMSVQSNCWSDTKLMLVRRLPHSIHAYPQNCIFRNRNHQNPQHSIIFWNINKCIPTFFI